MNTEKHKVSNNCHFDNLPWAWYAQIKHSLRTKEGKLKLDHSKTGTGIKQQYVWIVEITYMQNRAYDNEAYLTENGMF